MGAHPGLRDTQRAASQQRREDIPQAHVKGGGRQLADPRPLTKGKLRDLPVDEVAQALLTPQNGLGLSGRTRGKDDVIAVFGLADQVKVLDVPFLNLVQHHQLSRKVLQQSAQLLFLFPGGNQHPGSGFIEDLGEIAGRKIQVKRQKDATGLGNPQNAAHIVATGRQSYPHHGLPTHTAGPQGCTKGIGALIKRRIGVNNTCLVYGNALGKIPGHLLKDTVDDPLVHLCFAFLTVERDTHSSDLKISRNPEWSSQHFVKKIPVPQPVGISACTVKAPCASASRKRRTARGVALNPNNLSASSKAMPPHCKTSGVWSGFV